MEAAIREVNKEEISSAAPAPYGLEVSSQDSGEQAMRKNNNTFLQESGPKCIIS